MKTTWPRVRRTAYVAFALTAAAAGAEAPRVSILVDGSAGSPARIALAAVEADLARRGVVVRPISTLAAVRGGEVLVLGTANGASPGLRAIAADLRLSPPPGPESLVIERRPWQGGEAVIALGGDDLGLAYALYDISDRIEWGARPDDPFAAVRDASERPAVRDRSVSTYTMQQAYFEQRLFDENYWRSYFDQLVRCRFNNFTLIFGYETSGFLAPPYPWFFNLPQFPDVRAVGVTAEAQARYVHALNRMIELAHERGLHFTLGIWDHIYHGRSSSYYTPGVWEGLPLVDGRRPPWPVQGLDGKNLTPYTVAALCRFLQLVPGIDGIQFRMHGESGLKAAGMKRFWDAVFHFMATEHPHVRFDARAKNLPRDLIEDAVRDGVPLRLTTKYFYEQVGLPFHLLLPQRVDQFDSRQSYFDLLRYPKIYGIQWREWTSGTLRILWWGDPAFARRFAESTHLYDGDGFEVAEPLATKMASQPHDRPPIPIFTPGHRYGRYEFERYWPFFRAFGLYGYDPATPADAWNGPFTAHFGAAGPALERALSRASWILPHVVEYCLPQDKFPTTRGWPERQRWDDLPVYAAADPTDPALYESFSDEARLRLEGRDTPKVKLETTSAWFERAAADVLRETREAEKAAGTRPGVEFVDADTDLRILAHLAEYHSRRIHAGLEYALFRATGDVQALDAAIAWERRAVAAWRAIVAAAGDVYSDNLALGLPLDRDDETPKEDLSGHWRDELPRFAAELSALERERAAFAPQVRRGSLELHLTRGQSVADIAAPNGSYELTVSVVGPQGPMEFIANGIDYSGTFTVPAGRRVEKSLFTSVFDGRLAVLFRATTGGIVGAASIRAVRVDPLISSIPVGRLAPGADLRIEASIAGIDAIRNCRVIWGDDQRGFRATPMTATGARWVYGARIPAAELAGQRTGYFIEAEDASGRLGRWPASGRVQVEVTADTRPPTLTYTRIDTAEPGRPLRIVAEAADPSGVRWVRLRYRSVTQFQDYRELDMLPTGVPGQYAAVIPGRALDPRFDFMYFVEAMDQAGNGAIYPDPEVATPYVVVRLHGAESERQEMIR